MQMHSNVRTDVLSLPPEEQLAYALELLDTLCGQGDDDITYFKNMGLTKSEAILVGTLNRNAGRVVTKESLYTALYGGSDETELKIIDVLICKARKKLPKNTVYTVWGDGYKVMNKHDIPTTEYVTPKLAIRSTPAHDSRANWTKEDDENLRDMVRNGSELWAIADDLSRTQRSCTERMQKMDLRIKETS